jgi:uncharacterized membrane protein YdjX (TVP38/TMEM64 family)
MNGLARAARHAFLRMPEEPAREMKQGLQFWVGTGTGVILVALLVWLVDLKALHDWAGRLNGTAVFALMVVLPLIGVPVSVLYAVGGAKFGQPWGLVLAAAAIAAHLVASWWIAHSWLRRPLDALLRRMRYKKPQVPRGEYIPICLLIALIPGVSYTIKNYLMVLGGVPFRPFFWTCLPAHFFHAILGVLFGDFTGAMTTPKVVFLIAYALLLAGLSHYVVRRLRARKRLELQTVSR